MDSVVWCDKGFFPLYYGFCPNEKAWHKALKRLKVPSEPYPESDARVSTFTNLDTGDAVCIVTLSESIDTKCTLGTIGLMAHESVHVKQALMECIGETNPSSEFEAYVVQNILLNLLNAYQKTRGFLKDKP